MKNSAVCFVMAATGVVFGLGTTTAAAEPMAGVISTQLAAPQEHAVTEQSPTAEPKVSPEQRAAAEKLGMPVVITNSIQMKLVLIPAGEFLMGSPTGEEGRGEDEGPQHSVRITQSFYLGVHEVTVGQFRQFVEATDYRAEAKRAGEGGWVWTGKEWEGIKPEFIWRNIGDPKLDEYPVVNASWNDAVAYCQWLSVKEGRSYRLPTEAEWEYACRALSTTPFHWGTALNGMEANCNGYCPYGTSEKGRYLVRRTRVGSYAPNNFGLFDMHGNVWEWCQDWHDARYYANSPIEDPPGPATGSYRVLRGGSWDASASDCRSACRSCSDPVYRANSWLGFRVAMTPPDGSGNGVQSGSR